MVNKGEKEQFVVSDRRKFTSEGELRTDGPPAREEAEPAILVTQTPVTQTPVAPPTVAEATVADTARPQNKPQEEMPVPPSAAEQHTQHSDYQAAGKQIDSMLDAAGAKRPPDHEMNLEKLII